MTSSSHHLRVTVCELSTETPEALEKDWKILASHLFENHTDLVLLPEMPFHRWLPESNEYNSEKWLKSIKDHEKWINDRLDELNCPVIVGTRPAMREGKRFNEVFVWKRQSKHEIKVDGVQLKYYLPEENNFYEATWYQRGSKTFEPSSLKLHHRDISLGFQVCTELWFTHHSRDLGKRGCHIILNPRATERDTLDKWVVAGQAAAIMSGCWVASSNRYSDTLFGGRGYIVDPDGRVRGITTPQNICFTLNLDLTEAEKAKTTYPRYIQE